VASVTPARADETDAGHGPTITQTGQPPTGYEVTIRYQNSGATRVQIAPEMTFSDPALIKSTTQAEAKTGSQWEPGDVPANWKVYDMTKNAGGVWSFTTPLPSGHRCRLHPHPRPGQSQLEPGRHRRSQPPGPRAQ
jgi:hypothetical protein